MKVKLIEQIALVALEDLMFGVVQQRLDTGSASCQRRQVERCVAFNVTQIHIGVVVQKQEKCVLMTLETGAVKSCLT